MLFLRVGILLFFITSGDGFVRNFRNLASGVVSEILNNETPGSEVTYSYDDNDPYGPENWDRIDRTCDGLRQSPIDLQTESVWIRRRDRLTISELTTRPISIDLTNTGHGAQIAFNFPNAGQAVVSGGPLLGEYKIAQAHWHWGETDGSGSEHLLNSKRYAAELHVVTYNSRYASVSDAKDRIKGLAVLGFFYELDETATSDLLITNWLANIIENDSSYTEAVNTFTINNLIKEAQFDYLSYQGSLTTPTCDETVTWMVSTKPLKIKSADLAEFRKIKDKKGNLVLLDIMNLLNMFLLLPFTFLMEINIFNLLQFV
ncbi:CLUMA_CG018856, isoform A [Clunio marinus]|uniref:Carbonic anhydrase n=1 Tax=Clunio marinus TaxID=568069 RepID=A0A1J1J046_9DIPT|nr:CLUMA_CG018856, isoform A [Clunio marinus]